MDGKYCSHPFCAPHKNLASMGFNDLPGDRQPKSCSNRLSIPMSSGEKRVKDLLQVLS